MSLAAHAPILIPIVHTYPYCVSAQVYEQELHGSYKMWLVGAWPVGGVTEHSHSDTERERERAADRDRVGTGAGRYPETVRLERILLNASRPPCALHKIRTAANYALFVSALDRPPTRTGSVPQKQQAVCIYEY